MVVFDTVSISRDMTKRELNNPIFLFQLDMRACEPPVTYLLFIFYEVQSTRIMEVDCALPL